MKYFSGTFESVEKRLLDNGFTLVGEIEPFYVAKFPNGEFITVTTDFETILIYKFPLCVTDEEFINMFDSYTFRELRELRKYEVRDNRCNIMYALGYQV